MKAVAATASAATPLCTSAQLVPHYQGFQGAAGSFENFLLGLEHDGVQFPLIDQTFFKEELPQRKERVTRGFIGPFGRGLV